MKTYLNKTLSNIAFVAIITISLNACQKKSSEIEPVILDDIIGTWTATEAITVITYQGMSAYDYWISQGATPEEATYQVGYQTRGFGDYIPFSFEFKEDGTYNTINGAVGDVTGTTNNGTWKLSDDRTTLTIDGFDAPVLTLTKNEFSYQIVFDSNEYTMDEYMTYDITLKYTKP